MNDAIDLTELFARLLDHALHLLFIRHIGANEQHLASRVLDGSNLVVVRRQWCAPDENESRVDCLRKVLRKLETHTAHAAGDQVNSAIFQLHRLFVRNIETDLFEILYPAMPSTVSNDSIRTLIRNLCEEIVN